MGAVKTIRGTENRAGYVTSWNSGLKEEGCRRAEVEGQAPVAAARYKVHSIGCAATQASLWAAEQEWDPPGSGSPLHKTLQLHEIFLLISKGTISSFYFSIND